MSEDFAAVLGGFRAGSRLAGYLLEEQIGHGGMAVVFRALDERLNRQVALKILAPAVAADEAFRQRFIRESQVAAAVDDPHIIPVFEAGEAGEVLFIAMRLVRGGDITTLIRREGPLTPRRATAIISPIASCLDAAHEAGLVHRDIKPANMLLDIRPGRPDHVYLSDFGLSKAALGLSAITATGQFLGTPDYMAPEQITGKAVDGKADQYALAVTAFELLSGAPPFRNEEPMAVIYAHASSPPPSLARLRPDLPTAVDVVFGRALAKAPGERYGSCQEFADALRRALGVGSYDAHTEFRPQTPAPYPSTEAVPIVMSSAAGGGPGPGPVDAGLGVAGPPTEASSPTPGPSPSRAPATPATPPPTPVLPWPAGHDGSYPTAYQPPRRAGGRIAGIAAALLIVAAGIGAALYLLKPSSGTLSHRHHHSGGGGGPVNWSGHPTARPLLVNGGGARANVVEGLAFSPDGKTVAIATVSMTFLVDVETANTDGVMSDPDGSEVLAVAYSPDGNRVATADKNGHVYLWNPATDPPALTATLADPAGDSIFSVAFSPDGSTLAAGDSNGITYLWSVGSGTPAALPFGHLADPSGSRIQGLAFSPDGKTLGTGDQAGTAYLWNLGSGSVPPVRPTSTLTGPPGASVQTVGFSPDGRTFATGDSKGNAYLWSATASGQSASPEATLVAPAQAGAFGVVAVAFSPDGATIATGGYTGQTYLWSTATRSVITTLTDPDISGANPDVQAAAFSPDGKQLATGDTNGGTYLWTPNSAQ
ncbi:MAG TPA: serine/threonine-protein kinase [Streptosporangiaceae bacterium]|nr:serine/threonine-protein kinase [Streptosporangiaceae bacterium]